MPQKRNPDAAELVRAKAGRVIGALTTLLVAMKGLPLAYGKDMQEDKEPVFDAFDTLALSVCVMTGMLKGAAFDTGRMKAAAGAGFATATDLADWLVRVPGMPFRRAHEVTGRLVTLARERAAASRTWDWKHMRAVEPGITEAVFEVLGVDNLGQQPDQPRRLRPRQRHPSGGDARRRFLGTGE